MCYKRLEASTNWGATVSKQRQVGINTRKPSRQHDDAPKTAVVKQDKYIRKLSEKKKRTAQGKYKGNVCNKRRRDTQEVFAFCWVHTYVYTIYTYIQLPPPPGVGNLASTHPFPPPHDPSASHVRPSGLHALKVSTSEPRKLRKGAR